MKFEELQKICEVVDTTKPRDSRPPWSRGPVKCVGCDFWPQDKSWLNEKGECGICSNKAINRARTAETFSKTEAKMCMRCSESFYNMNPSGYCTKCKVIIEEEGSKAAIEATYGDAEKKIHGGYFCYSCFRFGANSRGGKCVTCETGKETTLQYYYCVKCRKTKATVLSGTCSDCLKESNPVVDVNPPNSRPRLVKYEKQGDGWVERVVYDPNNKRGPLSATEKLGVDSRLGSVGGE